MPSPDRKCSSCCNDGRLHVLGRRHGDAEAVVYCECRHGRRVEREDRRSSRDSGQEAPLDAGQVSGEVRPGPNYTPDPDLDP